MGDIDMCQYRYFADLVERRLGADDQVGLRGITSLCSVCVCVCVWLCVVVCLEGGGVRFVLFFLCCFYFCFVFCVFLFFVGLRVGWGLRLSRQTAPPPDPSHRPFQRPNNPRTAHTK